MTQSSRSSNNSQKSRTKTIPKTPEAQPKEGSRSNSPGKQLIDPITLLEPKEAKPQKVQTQKIIKTRKFGLQLASKPQKRPIPPFFQKLLIIAEERCRTDSSFCLAMAQDPTHSYAEIFKQNGIKLPSIIPENANLVDYVYQSLHYHAQELLLTKIYPQQFLQLEDQIGQTFHTKPPEFFKSTSLSAVKKNVINKNVDLRPKTLKHHFPDQPLFLTRTVWVGVRNVYYA
ncbi:MAG: DUF5343 domain-containing protein, partial [Patescibacteria group bacterium]|nr:DUF5343 domain-containing protein [Patescibacteria group bacterium]